MVPEEAACNLRNWQLHYPQCNLSIEWHHWKHFIKLHAASPGAPKGLILLYSLMQLYSPRPINTLQCKKKKSGVTLKYKSSQKRSGYIFFYHKHLNFFFLQETLISSGLLFFSQHNCYMRTSVTSSWVIVSTLCFLPVLAWGSSRATRRPWRVSSHSFRSLLLQYPSVISHVISLITIRYISVRDSSQGKFVHISAIIKKSLQLSDIQHSTLPPASSEVSRSN